MERRSGALGLGVWLGLAFTFHPIVAQDDQVFAYRSQVAENAFHADAIEAFEICRGPTDHDGGDQDRQPDSKE